MPSHRARLSPPANARVRWVAWAGVAALLAVALLAPASPALSSDTPGNNGTVKIHDTATDTEPIVHNEPHVCTFHLHFFFADPFQAGAWEIQEWSPGDKGTVVLTGSYDTTGHGEDRQPEAGAYSLPSGHYKLFWDGDLDTQKHDKMKVFWVDCPAPTQSQAGETGAPTEVATVPPTTPPTGQPTQSVGAETETPTEQATPTFGQSVGAETSVPSFEQSVAAETSVTGGTGGPGATLPNTSTAPASAPDDTGWRGLMIALAFLIAVVLLADPTRPLRRERRH